MKTDHIVEALTGDSGWKDMIPQVNSSDFPTQWVPSAYECSIIDAQAKEIEKLRGQLPRWIPVEERLPENFRKVLCWGEYFRYGDFNGMFVNYALGYQNNGSWGGEVANGTNARALAWMPLPEPPKEK